MRARLYSSCVQSSMLYGCETWPVRKENVVALQQAEMRIIRWMCDVKVKYRVPTKKIREDIISVLQQNMLPWYGHVLRKEDSEDLERGCAKILSKLHTENAMNRSR